MGDPSAKYSNGVVKLNGVPKDDSIPAAGNRGDSPNSANKPISEFFRNVKADLVNKNLLPVKVLFFFKYATLFVLYPFLILQLKSLGFDEAEAGVINAFIPIVGILGPPLAGIVADKLGNFKILLAVITLLNAPLALLLLAVPKARENVLLSNSILFSLGCGSLTNTNLSGLSLNASLFQLASLESSICTLMPSSKEWNDQSNIVAQCGYVCPRGHDYFVNGNVVEEAIDKIPIIPSSLNKVYGLPDGKSIFVPLFFNNSGSINLDRLAEQQRQQQQLNCDSHENGNCSMIGFDALSSSDKRALGLLTLDYSELRWMSGDIQNTDNEAAEQNSWKHQNDSAIKQNQLNVSQPVFAFQGPFKLGKHGFNAGQEECAISAFQGPWNEFPIRSVYTSCVPQCLTQMNRTLFCSNTHEFRSNNVLASFLFYTFARVLLGVFSATGFVMFEGAVIIIIKEYGGDYGLQRVTATFAGVVASPLAGFLIQFFDDFRPAFYLYGVLQIISTILTIKIDLEFRKPGEKVLKHLKEVLSQIEILVFFFAMLLSGTAWGYLESFLFWFLETLGASKVLMGLTISVGGLAGIPLLICSRPIIKKFGHVNVLSFGLLCFFFRLVGYSYIENPWTCLVFEAMEAFTAALAITAAATYAANLSTAQTIATVQGIWGSLYFGVGRGAGSLFGGFFQKWYGARQTFRIFAVMSIIGSFLYFVVNQLYLKKHTTRKVDGLDLGDVKGNRKAREEKENAMNGSANGNANGPSDKKGDVESPVIGIAPGAKFDGGYNGVCDVDKFTDVPLDEEPPTKTGDNRRVSASDSKLQGLKNRLRLGSKNEAA